MKKYFYLMLAAALFITINPLKLKASVLDELNYVSEKSDFYTYINFSQMIDFLKVKGIDTAEIDSMVENSSNNDMDKVIKGFGLKFSDVNEFLMVMNTQDLEKKTGYLVFISFKNGKGIIPEDFKKNAVKIKSGTAYKASADEDVVFTKIDNFFVIGSIGYIDSFIEKKMSKTTSLSARSGFFIKKTSGKSLFFHLTVSDYLKNAMNSAMSAGGGMAKGLKENVFIQTILSLESFDWGMDMSDKFTFQAGLHGTKAEDSERLEMLCHTWIVGSSFVVSFADLMAARSGDQKLNEITSDQQLMNWMQKAFGRIHTTREDKGVTMSFEMTSSETDLLVSYLKKEIEKEKKLQAERLEREKISRLTLAIKENDSLRVEKFIKEKYKLDNLDTDGRTPLGTAAIHGNVKIAKILVEKGAGLNTTDIDTLAPIHHAVKAGNTEVAVFLLSKGCDVNIKDNAGMTALHLNSMQGNAGITRMLLAKGALINSTDSDGSTPLHLSSSEGKIEVVKVLVEKKADPELVNSNEQRAIDIASQNGHAAVVEFLKLKFKQEPKSYSGSENNSNEDFNADEETAPGDSSKEPIIEEDID